MHQVQHHISNWFSASTKVKFWSWVSAFPKNLSSFALGRPQITMDWNVFMCTKPHLWLISCRHILTHGYLYTAHVQAVLGLVFFSNLIKTPPIYCSLYCCLTIAPHYILPGALSENWKYSNMICWNKIEQGKCKMGHKNFCWCIYSELIAIAYKDHTVLLCHQNFNYTVITLNLQSASILQFFK